MKKLLRKCKEIKWNWSFSENELMSRENKNWRKKDRKEKGKKLRVTRHEMIVWKNWMKKEQKNETRQERKTKVIKKSKERRMN